MKHYKWLAFLSLALSVVVLVSGLFACSSTPDKIPTINMIMAPPFNTWMSTYAIREGIVTSDKVKVNVDIAADYNTQILAGNYPMGALPTANFAVATQTSNIPFRALSTYIVQEGSQAADGVNFVVTKAGSDIKSPADLVGFTAQTYNAPRAGTSVFLAFLKSEYGISEDQLTLVDNSETLLMPLLQNGEIDAAMLGKNFGVQAAADPADYSIIWNLDQSFIDELLKQSNQYGEQHLQELADKYAAEYGQTGDFYVMVYQEHSGVQLNPIEGQTLDSLMAIFQFVKDRGVIDALPDPSVVFVSP